MSGDRDNTTRAAAPALPQHHRRAGHAVRLATGLSLAALGLALASIPASGDPAADHPQVAPQQTADAQPADAGQAEPAAKNLHGSRPPSAAAADGPRANARARADGRPATGPAAIDPAAIPWNEIAAFMRQHSPLKWERWEQFSRPSPGPMRGGFDRSEIKRQIEEGIRAQYAELKKIESIDADEYKMEVHRVEIEDRIFGATADFRRGAGDVAKQSLARKQMEEHVRELLGLREDLRRHRLERRKAELERQLADVAARLDARPKPSEAQITGMAKKLLTIESQRLWDRPDGRAGPGGPRSGQPRRDGPPDGREPRAGRAGPTTDRSGDEDSSPTRPLPPGDPK